MPPSLYSALAKLDRAESHLNVLGSQVSELLRHYTERISFKPGPKPGQNDLYIIGGDPVPEDWPAIVGDFAHNARCVLDHLIYQLSITESEPDPSSTQFPICSKPSNFASKGTQEFIRKLSDKQVAVVERFQPYNSSNRPDPLELLQAINNTDKHRRLSLFVSTLDFNFEVMNLQEGAKLYIECISRNPSESDTPLIRISGTIDQMDVDAKPTLSVFFDEGHEICKGLPLRRTLEPILDRVKQIVDECRQFF